MDLKNLVLEERDGWFELTVNRPSALNALNAQILDELARVIEELSGRAEIRGMILTGAGEKAFVAGADISELADLSSQEAIRFAQRGQGIFSSLENCGKPVIAAVNGYALGGGCELALACHVRVLSDNAKIGLPEVSLGVIPGYGGTQRLARIVGAGRALEMILSGDPISATDAHRIGLANQVCEQAALLQTCRGLAGRISLRAPRAVSLALESVLAGRNQTLPDALAFEAAQFGKAAATEDWREGTHAFLEKRKAQFSGK